MSVRGKISLQDGDFFFFFFLQCTTHSGNLLPACMWEEAALIRVEGLDLNKEEMGENQWGKFNKRFVMSRETDSPKRDDVSVAKDTVSEVHLPSLWASNKHTCLTLGNTQTHTHTKEGGAFTKVIKGFSPTHSAFLC